MYLLYGSSLGSNREEQRVAVAHRSVCNNPRDSEAFARDHNRRGEVIALSDDRVAVEFNENVAKTKK